MPLPAGKLPPELLARLIGRIPLTDPSVVVGSRPGVDAAAIRTGGRLLIATADPITFVSSRIGWYAVHVNANDIAVMGGQPRWMLATVLLPESTEPALVEEIHTQMLAACAELGITLVGGHTEVTVRLDRPIVAGTMLGEVEPERLVTPRARPGDRLIITGGIAIEGTAALAGEPAALRLAGVPEETISAAARLLEHPGISVVRDATALCAVVGPHALHDATEGGLATALRELAEASRTGLRIDAMRIPVLPETRSICDALGLNPLGLLASGCLLAAVAPEDEGAALVALGQTGRLAVTIGEVTAAEAGLTLSHPAGDQPLPSFPRDELARWLTGG